MAHSKRQGLARSAASALLAVAIIGNLTAFASASKTGLQAMDAKMIHIELVVTNCSAEVYLNDIPIKKLGKDSQRFISIPAHQFLIEGTNILELVVNPGETPSVARKPGRALNLPDASAEAQVVRYAEGMFTGDKEAEKLAVAVWRFRPADQELFPKIVPSRFALSPAFGRWAWQDAEAIDLGRDMEAIRRTVQIVFDAFRTGQADPVLELGATRLQEGSRAYPARSLESLRARQSDYFRRNAARDGWSLVPLEPSNFDFRLCANARMVEIIDKNWESTVRSKPVKTGEVFPFPMFLAKIKGKFVIIR